MTGLRTFGTAEINIVPIVETLTKYSVMVNEPEDIRFHLEKAVYLATSGRPGPVWLDIPMDIQYALIDPDMLEGFIPEEDQPITSDSNVLEFIKLLSNAERPLVIAGNGILNGESESEFIRFIETTGIPTVFSRFAYQILPYSHPLNFGLAGIKGTRFCPSILKSADVVLCLGCRLAPQLSGHNFDCFNSNASVVMVDLEDAELDKPGVSIDLPIRSDVKQFLQLFLARCDTKLLPKWTPWVQQCSDLKNRLPTVVPELERNPIDLYYFMSRLDALSDNRHILITDAGSNYYVGGQVFKFEKGQREITSGTFASMGLTIPLAIGAGIADPDAQVLAVTGDGSLELNLQELKTMSHYGLNIKLFVINNGGYASMRNWQDGFFEGRRIDTADNTGAGTLNMENIAKAFDLKYQRIDSFSEIDQHLKDLIADESPVFIEVICDENQEIIQPIHDLAYNTTV